MVVYLCMDMSTSTRAPALATGFCRAASVRVLMTATTCSACALCVPC
jgi:hypothetical protein